jgi:hypothetical protein
MKMLAGQGRDDHVDDDSDRSQVAWSVAVLDDCEVCGDLRVEIVFEDIGRPGAGTIAHLTPDHARDLRRAIAVGLREIGQDAGP